MKKIAVFVIAALFIFSSIGAYAADPALKQPVAKSLETTKDRVSRGVNNIFYGPTETLVNLNDTETKGEPIERCTPKTRTGVERGIARLVGGVWQVATFWYSDPGCVTSTVNGKAAVPESASSAPIERTDVK